MFGDIKLKVQQAESNILSIQALLDAGPTDSLHQDLSKAISSLHNWLQTQETHWCQKARTRWLSEGDRNTSFFHASAKSRGVINRISKILSNGNWVEDPKQIQLLAIAYFSSVAQSPTSVMDENMF